MGASLTAEEEVPALPQQHIINVSDGGASFADQATSSTAANHFGTTKQTVAVKPIFTLSKDSLGDISLSGELVLEVTAAAEGMLELLGPAAERSGDGQWPRLSSNGCKIHRRVSIARGKQTLRVEVGSIAAQDLQDTGQVEKQSGDSEVIWPLLLILRPGQKLATHAGALAEDPPDGSLMVFYGQKDERLAVKRQVMSWGAGSAFEVKDMFGIQEARTESLSEAKQCVICLTEPRDTALLPCSHFCACYTCAVSIRISPARNRCPLCRVAVEDLVRLDMSEQPEGAFQEGGGDESDLTSTSPAGEETRDSRPAASSSAASSSSAGVPLGSSPLGMPPRCLQRLSRELKQLEKDRGQDLKDHGVEVTLADPEGSDLRGWHLRLHRKALDADSQLYKELCRWNVDSVDLEVWIPNGFPSAPPHARVLQPCFNAGSFFVHKHGALCMEILTLQGWSPAMSLSQLGLQVKATMQQGKGSIAGTGFMADPGLAGRTAASGVAQQIERAHEKDWSTFGTK